ncbi:MAG: ABC-2 family transporter protein [Clostridiales bacterium]|nr:ABC-2 family transporter protein [Clostridiales bacterium]
MLMYVLLSTIVNEIAFSETMSEITYEVHHGTIGMRLMKPINYRAQLGFSQFGIFVARALIVGLPMTVISSLILVFGFGLGGIYWYNILLFIPAVFFSMLLEDAIAFLFGQLAFRTQAMFGVHSMSNVVIGFLSGAFVPLALFPTWAQTVLSYTPFPSIMSFPVRLFLGQLGWADVAIGFGIAAAWIVLLNVIGLLLYKTSVRKVVVFGG